MNRPLQRSLRYGVAVLAVGAAVLVKLILDPLTAQQTPFLLVLGAIVISAWYGGLGPGLLATGLSALAVDYFFFSPQGSLEVFGPELADMSAFVLEGVLVSVLTSSLRSARHRAERSTLEARSHEEGLRESEERFRLMVEGVRDYAIFMIDPGGCVTTWNEGAGRIEGYEEAEILGRHFSVFYPEDEVARGHPEEALRAALAEGRYVEEGQWVREDGSRFWASTVVTVLRGREGNLEGFSVVVHDATERREAEYRLKEAEARFRTLVEHIPAMTYMEAADRAGQSNSILYMSPQIEAVLGYSPGEWVSDPGLFRRTLHPDDRTRVLAEDARTNRTGEPFSMEYRHLARDGRVVWVRDEAVLVSDQEGGPPYWLGVQFDITDRREAEEALRESEGRYRTVVKQAAEGIFVIDIDTKLILEANEAYRDLLGYSAQDMLGLGLTLYDVVAHDRESIDHYVERVLEKRVEFIGERRHRRKDGSLIDVEVGSSVVSYGGGEALCVIVHDITERRRSAERLQRSLDALLALYEAGQILSSSLQREEIGQRLLEIAGRVSSLTAAVIAVPDEEGELGIWRSTGLTGLWLRVRSAPEAVAARGRVLQTRKHQSARLRPPGDDDGEYLVSLNLPLLVRGRLIGVLEAYGPEALMERQNEETLISLANQGASALENARLYADLAERENRLQDLIRKLITAQEEERRKVSYEVHDGLAQTAAAAHQLLQAFARHHPPDSEEGRKELARALQLVQQTVGEARYVIADLRPTALDDLGLGAAVRLQVEKVSDEGSQVDYEEALGDGRLPPEVETALFRVTQEALTNVRKHAPSARVKITLRHLNDCVHLNVRDWGPGFEPEKSTDGGGPGERLGLSSMRERVALLGGHLEVRSRPGEGTEVVAEIPSVQANGKGR